MGKKDWLDQQDEREDLLYPFHLLTVFGCACSSNMRSLINPPHLDPQGGAASEFCCGGNGDQILRREHHCQRENPLSSAGHQQYRCAHVD